MTANGTSRFPRLSRRTRIVLGSFLASMAAVTGLLALGEHRASPGFPAAKASLLPAAGAGDPIFAGVPVDSDRWRGVLIHHSGEPAGDADSIRRLHVGHGARSLGYHFVIGNGNGLGDGVIHVGERWIRQESGWHAVGPHGDYYNRHAVAICLVGNGDRREFTERQIAQLVELIRRLQRGLELPPSSVRLHRDVAAGLTSSPGAYFPAAVLEQQLRLPLR